MLFIKKLFDFYIKSSFHLGVCVVSLYIISIYKLQIDLNYYILTCLFSSTIVVYNFIKYAGVAKLHHRSLTNNLKVIQIFSLGYGSVADEIKGSSNIKEGISWEGHLAGLITGFVFALIYKTPEYKKLIKFDWERPDYNPAEDKFMQRFDEISGTPPADDVTFILLEPKFCSLEADHAR